MFLVQLAGLWLKYVWHNIPKIIHLNHVIKKYVEILHEMCVIHVFFFLPLFPPSPCHSVPPPPDVSSELGVRLRAELEHTERLDAQFVEYLRCRGMNPAANTDSAAGSWSFSDELLSPELQVGLKRSLIWDCNILYSTTKACCRSLIRANTNAGFQEAGWSWASCAIMPTG